MAASLADINLAGSNILLPLLNNYAHKLMTVASLITFTSLNFQWIVPSS